MGAPNPENDGYPPRSIAWYTVFILMLCYTLSYADRQILAFLVGPLEQDLHISDTQVGLLQGLAFVLMYTLLGLPMGMLADRFNRRNIVALGVIVWCFMTALASFARSFWSLAATRMGVGIGEATLSPCAFSMIADSFPRERLSSAISSYTMGIQLGSGLALIIGGIVAQAVSHLPPLHWALVGPMAAWRVTFLIVAAPGVLVVLLLLTVREPARRALLVGSGGVARPLGPAQVLEQVLLRWRSVAGLAVMISCQATCNYALLTWGPTFFERVHHWPKARTGLVLGTTTLLCGCAGLFVGGYLSDRWQRQGVSDGGLRVGLISLLGMLATLAPAMLLAQASWTVALIALGVIFIGLPIGCGYAALQLIFPNQVRGFVSAVVIFAVALVGLGLGPLLPGLLNDRVLHDPRLVGTSIALTIASACLVGLVVGTRTLAHYRADYRAIHAS
jgi:MFS family permease